MYLYYDDWLTPKKGEYPLPCQTIENLSYEYTEKSGEDARNQSRFMVLVHFPSLKYRQIVHVQEYDIESLVGNIGGYIGLFLGYSLINFPRFVMSSFDIIRKKLFPGMNRKTRSSVRRKPIARNEAQVDVLPDATPRSILRNQQHVNLKNIRRELVTVVQRIDQVETEMLRADGGCYGSDNSSSPHTPIRSVRITEWNNIAQTPHYM